MGPYDERSQGLRPDINPQGGSSQNSESLSFPLFKWGLKISTTTNDTMSLMCMCHAVVLVSFVHRTTGRSCGAFVKVLVIYLNLRNMKARC